MHISSIAGTTAFKATVESQNPLVSGNWAFVQTQPQPAQAPQVAPKKGSFWKKAFWTAVTLAAAAGLLAWGRGTGAISNVMNKANTFSAAEGLKDKALWVLGKGGDYVRIGWTKAAGYVTNLFKKAPEAAEAVADK